MGNLIEAASNVFNQNNQTATEIITTNHDALDNNNEEQFDEFNITEEHIQYNPILALPSDILQLIVNELNPDLAELARYICY